MHEDVTGIKVLAKLCFASTEVVDPHRSVHKESLRRLASAARDVLELWLAATCRGQPRGCLRPGVLQESVYLVVKVCSDLCADRRTEVIE